MSTPASDESGSGSPEICGSLRMALDRRLGSENGGLS
jgi:hypothetical protein